MVLFSPAGGPRYRLTQHARFADHASFVRTAGLAAVVGLAQGGDRSFTQDPRVGPWVTVLRNDRRFAETYAAQNQQRYLATIGAMARTLYDRDTVPGAEPEDLMTLDIPALVVPGQDASHAPSAARYLQECLSRADYWDLPVAEQTAATVPPKVLEFLR
jgi:hypothetical protein